VDMVEPDLELVEVVVGSMEKQNWYGFLWHW
jgi:hypothetical protein